MPQYTHTTFSQLKTALANRLGDTTNSFWLNGANSGATAELGMYLIEALRTWSLLTGYWRDTGAFDTVSGTGFYDISTLTTAAPDSVNLLNYTVTDKDLSYLIQYHLLEPATGSTWTGSEQFTLADVTSALQRRRDALLFETGLVLASATQVQAANATTFDLPDVTMQVKNLRWTGATTGTDWPILPDDIDNQRNFSSSYLTTSGIPQTYSVSSVKPLRYVIAPPTSEPGTLRILSVRSGAALDASGVALGIPDDAAWIVKWGALADMLGREGPGQDLGRAYFCERRWKLGVALAQISQTIVNAKIGGDSLNTESINRLDNYSPNWHSATGVPTFVASLRNYVAIAPAPNAVYSIVLDVVRKANIPVNDSDSVQIGREYLNPILDYAEHLSAFKSGGMEFRHTYRAAENFFNAALSYNQRLAAQSPNVLELIRQSTLDDYVMPIKKKATNPPLEQRSQTDEQSAQLKSLYQG